MNRFTFAILSTGAASYALLQGAVVPVLPRIATEVGTDQQSGTWVLTGVLLSATVFTPIMDASATSSARTAFSSCRSGCCPWGRSFRQPHRTWGS